MRCPKKLVELWGWVAGLRWELSIATSLTIEVAKEELIIFKLKVTYKSPLVSLRMRAIEPMNSNFHHLLEKLEDFCREWFCSVRHIHKEANYCTY